MKLTIDLYDPSQRQDAMNILALFDQPEPAEEVTYLPEDAPTPEPVAPAEPAAPVEVPKVSLDPTPPPADPVVDPAPADGITAKDVQDLAMELNKAGKITRDDLVTRLASYNGATKISGLDAAGLAAFHAELLPLRGEANV